MAALIKHLTDTYRVCQLPFRERNPGPKLGPRALLF